MCTIYNLDAFLTCMPLKLHKYIWNSFVKHGQFICGYKYKEKNDKKCVNLMSLEHN